MVNFGSRTVTAAAPPPPPSPAAAGMDGAFMQREIRNVQASPRISDSRSNSRTTAPSRLDYGSMDILDDEETRLKELLSAQKDIMMDFQRKRSGSTESPRQASRSSMMMDRKPAAASALVSPRMNVFKSDRGALSAKESRETLLTSLFDGTTKAESCIFECDERLL